jgi:hypothetical protein
MTDDILPPVVEALSPVPGVVALALGGSRARGTAHPGSDYDVGLYYRAASPPDIEALRAALRPVVDDPAVPLTALGAWGPCIDGGGWLSVGGHKVDLLYRELTRVETAIADGIGGRVSMHYQPGHPHGFCSAIWMGEVALCRPLADAAGVLDALRRRAWPYPAALGQALIARFQWEVAFAIDNAALAVARDEQTHIAGCAYRALACAAQVLFAANGRYLINEKGALAEAETLPVTIPGLARLTAPLWAAIGGREYDSALRLLRHVATELAAAVSSG